MGSQEEEEYQVERIVEMRKMANGTFEYLVKWVGYPEEDNTWEVESNVSECKEMINEIKQRKQKEKEPDKERKRKANQSRIESSSSSSSSSNDSLNASSLADSTEAKKPKTQDIVPEDDEIEVTFVKASSALISTQPKKPEKVDMPRSEAIQKPSTKQSSPPIASEPKKGETTDDETDTDTLEDKPRTDPLKGEQKTTKPETETQQMREVEKVIGVDDSSDVLRFRVKWADSKETGFIPAEEANVLWTNLVINYYDELFSGPSK